MSKTPKPLSNFEPTVDALPPINVIGTETHDRREPPSNEDVKTDIGRVGRGLVERRFEGKLGF